MPRDRTPTDDRHDAIVTNLDEMQIRITRLIDGFEERQHSRHLAQGQRINQMDDELRRILAAVVANIEQLQRTTNRVEHALAELAMGLREAAIRDKALVEPEGVELDWSDHPSFSGDLQPQRPSDCPPEQPASGERPADCPPEVKAAELDKIWPPVVIPTTTPSVCLQCHEPLSGSCVHKELAGGHIHAGCAEAWDQNQDNPEHPDHTPF